MASKKGQAMKWKHHFEDENGTKHWPGEKVDEQMFDPSDIEGLKERGYIADGDGFDAGKQDFSKMSRSEMQAYGTAMGLDVTRFRSKRSLRDALTERHNMTTQAAAAPEGEQKAAVIVFGPKITPKVQDVPVANAAEAPAKAAEVAKEAREEQKAEAAAPAAEAPKPAPQKTASRDRGGNPVA